MADMTAQLFALAGFIGEPRVCIVRYKFCGNGPWNYMFERPPAGITHVYFIGLFIGETERDYLVASDYMRFEDGTIKPIHEKHFGKNMCEMEFI